MWQSRRYGPQSRKKADNRNRLEDDQDNEVSKKKKKFFEAGVVNV